MNEQKMLCVLQALRNGGRCAYAPNIGGVMLFNREGKREDNGIDISMFLKLREQSLIDVLDNVKDVMLQGHMIFPSNTRVDTYRITEAGREYLKRLEEKET